MQVRVFTDNGHDTNEFEFYSKYNRINAKNIKDEIVHQMYLKFGSAAKRMEITGFYRV